MSSSIALETGRADGRTLGTAGILIAGVALVVSASAFVSEFSGFIQRPPGARDWS